MSSGEEARTMTQEAIEAVAYDVANDAAWAIVNHDMDREEAERFISAIPREIEKLRLKGEFHYAGEPLFAANTKSNNKGAAQ